MQVWESSTTIKGLFKVGYLNKYVRKTFLPLFLNNNIYSPIWKCKYITVSAQNFWNF